MNFGLWKFSFKILWLFVLTQEVLSLLLHLTGFVPCSYRVAQRQCYCPTEVCGVLSSSWCTRSSFSPTTLSNTLLMLNFMMGKQCKYSKANFTFNLQRLWIIFILYFLSIVLLLFNLDLSHLKIIATHFFCVVHNCFVTLTSRLKQYWLC